MAKHILPLAALLCFSNCTIIREDIRKTGLFGDDLEKMMAAYQEIRPDQTTREDLERIGFKLKGVSNVEQSVGSDAIKAMFGSNVFQSAGTDKAKVDEFMSSMNDYEMFLIPFRDIVTTTDRIYWSRRDMFREGKDAAIIIIFKGNKVIFRGKRSVDIKEKVSDYAFGQGFLELIEKVATFSGNTNGLFDRLGR
ncbi:MAG: hypothetical protein AAB646_00720 [Patescibacteria group bacterium]